MVHMVYSILKLPVKKNLEPDKQNQDHINIYPNDARFVFVTPFVPSKDVEPKAFVVVDPVDGSAPQATDLVRVVDSSPLLMRK